ncbi:MAG TPA: hypothetical protein VLA04_01340 [Verrucomicrobiae bacterium]|nr:hypothetical protein [Verrucomicrobiae bacterium]
MNKQPSNSWALIPAAGIAAFLLWIFPTKRVADEMPVMKTGSNIVFDENGRSLLLYPTDDPDVIIVDDTARLVSYRWNNEHYRQEGPLSPYGSLR